MPDALEQQNPKIKIASDLVSLSEIYDRYYLDIYRYVRYRIGDESLVDDITSEVFLRFVDAVHKKHGPTESIRGWLIGIANHVVTDHIRQLYRHPLQQLLDTIPSDSTSLPDEIEKREEKYSLHWAIAQLTKDQQHVLALLFGQGCSLDETAALLNKNVNSVKALRFRALAALRKKISDLKNE